jgi:hypothetical protein
MKSVLVKRTGVFFVSLIMAITLLVPPSGLAQGRGHGRGLSKKSVKFVNGHDARDGRWDRRGPRPRVMRGWNYVWDGRHRRWVRVKHKRIVRTYIR